MVVRRIELTEPQLQTFDDLGREVLVVDPRSQAEYVLVPAGEFAAVRVALEEERQEAVIREFGRRAAILREGDEP